MVAAQLVNAVPHTDAKFYAATQTMDEARHVDVFSRYLRDKLEWQWPGNDSLKELLDATITDARWDIKYLGMQIIIEGLAMAAFGSIHQLTTEPLLKDLLHYVMRDESRHVAFGVLSLQDYYRRHHRPRAARARGVPVRGLPADARPSPHGGRLAGDGLAGGRGA